MPFDLDAVRAQLARGPATLEQIVAPLPEPWLHLTEGSGTWSPIQIVRHLVWGEVDDWIPRARLILEHRGAVAFTPFDREAGESRYGDWSIRALLDEFARLRAGNLQALDELGLGPESLAVEGRHPDLGTVTMAELLATWAAHDLTHLTQILRVLTRQYRGQVGPWRRYMRLLQDDAGL
jgi:hypothetical protein